MLLLIASHFIIYLFTDPLISIYHCKTRGESAKRSFSTGHFLYFNQILIHVKAVYISSATSGYSDESVENNYTHTHTHTHTRTHARTHAHTHTHTREREPKREEEHIH